MKDGTYRKDLFGYTPVLVDSGYWVSSTQGDVDPDTLENGEYLGVWTDDNGTVHYDRSHLIMDKGTALILCRFWNQIAIWDNANGKAIPMNPNY
jgi:hypothetical protein